MAKTPESLTDYLKLSDKEKLELMQPESSIPSADLLECVWTEDEDGNWNTQCGEMFVLTTDYPSVNGMIYCHHCGKKLKEVLYSNEKADASAERR